VTVGKSKTAHGAGRAVPLNSRSERPDGVGAGVPGVGIVALCLPV